MATYINPDAIKGGTISASKTDETIATKEELTELQTKVGEFKVKDASVSGNTLNITKEDGTILPFTPQGEDNTLRRDLGKYTSNEQYAAISVAQSGKAINANGEVITKTGYGISNEIAVTKGSIYLFKSNSDIVDVALFTQKIVADIVYSTIEETITTAEGESVTRLKSKTTAKGVDLKSHTYEFVYNAGNETAVCDNIKDNGVAKGASFVIPTQYTEYIPMFSANGMAARPISGHYCLASSVSGTMVISAKTEDLTGYLIEVRYGVVASIVNNLARKADVEVVSGLYKKGVISQTQTWENDYSGYKMSNLVWGTIPQANFDLFISAGAEFNDTDAAITKTAPWGDEVQHLPGYFYLNGYGDISYNEMLQIYTRTFPQVLNLDLAALSWEQSYYNPTKIRTNIPFAYVRLNEGSSRPEITNPIPASSYNSYVPYAVMMLPQGTRKNSKGLTFASLKRLMPDSKVVIVHVVGLIQAASAQNEDYWYLSFAGATYLQTIHIKGIACSVSFAVSRWLRRESIRFMIDNATNTSAITLTLHADAYARLTEEDKAAATAKNINLIIA